MASKKTLEELEQNYLKAKKELEQNQHKLTLVENQVAYLKKRAQKVRTHRLITKGAAGTNGKYLPNMQAREPCNVIYQTAEDGLADTIVPRLETVGADLNHVFSIDDVGKALTLNDGRLEKAIRQNKAKLLILDPVQAFLGANVDMNRANEVRPIFRQLGEIAERTRCATVLIGHLNKASGTQSTYRGLGSIDLTAAVRSLLFVGKVKKDPNTRVLVQEKSSLAPPGVSLAFTLDEETGFQWIGEYDITADELLAGVEGRCTEKKVETEEKLIYDMLADGKRVANNDMVKAAEKIGISDRTLRDAKRNIGGALHSEKEGNQWIFWLKHANCSWNGKFVKKRNVGIIFH